VAPDSKAFDLAVFYRDHAPVLYRDRLGGHYTAEPFQGTPPNDSRYQPISTTTAAWTAPALRPTARFTWHSTAAALRRTGSACGSKASRISSWRRTRRWKSRPGRCTARPFMRRAATVLDGRVGFGRRGAHHLAQRADPERTRQAAGRGYTYREAQRLSGSCPMIWTWNGRAMQFVTDVLGVAPLGASDGEARTFR